MAARRSLPAMQQQSTTFIDDYLGGNKQYNISTAWLRNRRSAHALTRTRAPAARTAAKRTTTRS